MLLPSALPCDHAAQGMVSPPASPPKLSTTATFAVAPTSCFNLQSLMANAAGEHQVQQFHHDNYKYNQQHDSHAQHHLQSYFGGALLPQPLPTPPMAHAPSPMKLRLRTSFREDAPRGIVKRTAHQPRHKRTLSSGSSSSSSSEREKTPEPPTTPKRARIAPERMPLGLARADFHNLHEPSTPPPQDSSDSAAPEWTTEDDRILVELVLEKLKLSKAEWQDCARTLGKDRHVLSRRWKSLILNDDVGLKRRKVPSTWR